MSVFSVELKRVVDDSYLIETGYSLEEKLADEARSLFGGRRIAVITDDNVKPLYGDRISALLREAGFSAEIFSIAPGEKSKTRDVKARLEDEMLAKGFRRDSAVINVGGGVVSDLGGFLAGTFARGVPFVNYATTLLSAADASVGGKTAVDTPLATNLIGLFNQPEKVYIDVGAWKTLPRREISGGLAETIKHACLGHKGFFEYLEENIEKVFDNDETVCTYIARENCAVKYEVVIKDERESGLREILNLGHTVGRAIETLSDYRLIHGEAVAIGLTAQTLLSQRLGHMTGDEVRRVKALLQRAGLPVTIPEYINRDELVKKLYTDKKVRNGRLRFVVQEHIGGMVEFAPDVYSTEVDEETAKEIIFAM